MKPAKRPKLVTVHLEPAMLGPARKGAFNFMTRLKNAVEAGGAAKLRFRPLDAKRGPCTLWHMEAPPDADDALIFRRTYHYPFWHIEADPKRWRWPVAEAAFSPPPAGIAQEFAQRLRNRLWPDVQTTRGDEFLVPLQGHIRKCRSFQTMSPIDMVEQVGRTGYRACITLHPREVYDAADHAALRNVVQRHDNLRLGGDSKALLPVCAGVITMNSAVAFDGFILGKPAALFAQIDFHHIALNVAQTGAYAALAQLPAHRPDFAGYLHWFLHHAIDAMAPDAETQIRRALDRCGWRLGQPIATNTATG